MSDMRIACFYPPPEHWREYEIDTGRGVVRFEMHPYCGPIALGKKGDPLARQPGSRHPFWIAVAQWESGGRRIGEDGLCVWDPPTDPYEGWVRIPGTQGWVSPTVAERLGIVSPDTGTPTEEK